VRACENTVGIPRPKKGIYWALVANRHRIARIRSQTLVQVGTPKLLDPSYSQPFEWKSRWSGEIRHFL